MKKPVYTAAERTAKFCLYGLIFSSVFSMAAMTGFAILIYLTILIRWVVAPRTMRTSSALWWPLLGLFLSALLAALFSSNVLHSLPHLRDLWRYLLPVLLMTEIRLIRQKQTLIILGALIFLFSIYGVIQHFLGVDWLRPEGNQKVTPYTPDGIESGVFHAKGNFSHHLTFAHYLLLIVPVYLAMLFQQGLGTAARVGAAVVSTAGIAALVLTLGRSAWLGLLFAVIILMFGFPKRWKYWMITLSLVGLVALVISTKYHFSFQNYQQPIENAFKARIDSTFTLRHHRDRFFLWESAWVAIQDNWMFGIGPGMQNEVMPDYREQVEQKRAHTFLNQPRAGVHNIYLQMWLSYGIAGLVSFLAFWAIVVHFLIRTIQINAQIESERLRLKPWERSLVWGTLAGVCGFMLGGMFENNFLDGETQTLLFILIGWSFFLGRKLREHSSAIMRPGQNFAR